MKLSQQEQCTQLLHFCFPYSCFPKRNILILWKQIIVQVRLKSNADSPAKRTSSRTSFAIITWFVWKRHWYVAPVAFTVVIVNVRCERGDFRKSSSTFLKSKLRFSCFFYLYFGRHETININLSNKPEWYLKNKNPRGLVPTLELNGEVIYESDITSTFVDETYPGRKLTTTDSLKKAKELMFMGDYSKVSERSIFSVMSSLYIWKYSLYFFNHFLCNLNTYAKTEKSNLNIFVNSSKAQLVFKKS